MNVMLLLDVGLKTINVNIEPGLDSINTQKIYCGTILLNAVCWALV
jgi:hypothetical protein